MRYELYAYRPSIGVAVCKRGPQWLLVEACHQEGEAELISENTSFQLAEQLGLINLPKAFSNFSQLKSFLVHEYAAATASQGNAPEEDDSLEGLLDFMDQAAVLRLIDDLHMRQATGNPRKGIELLEAIEAHPKYMGDTTVLARLNPLKQALKRHLGRDHLAARQKLQPLLDAEMRYNALNGRLAFLYAGLVGYSSVAAHS